MSSLLLFKIFLIASMVSLALLGVYIFISSQIKKEKEMAHIPDYWNRLIKGNLSEYQRDRDGFDFEKFYYGQDFELVNPILNQEYYPKNSEIQPEEKELKRKIDIDE